MATPENKLQKAATLQSEPVPLPQQGKLIVSDSEHQIILEKTNGILSLQVNRLDKPLFSAAVTPESQVHLVFTPVQVSAPLSNEAVALSGQEARKAPEHPPITIEGFPVRSAKVEKDEKTGKVQSYSLTLAHHPNPDRRKEEVVYYEVVAEGEKAEACYKAYVTDSRTPVRITGDDYSYTQKRQGKPDRIVHKIQADSVEKIKDRLDSPDILPEKVWLSDLPA